MPSTYETEATTSPVFIGPGRISYPFSEFGDTTTVLVEQDFAVQAQAYSPPALSSTYSSSANLSTHPTGTLYCLGDTKPQEMESGLVSYTRSWSKVPQDRTEYSTSAQTFPGFLGSRGPVSFTSPAKIVYSYVYAAGGSGISLTQEARVIDTDTLNQPLLSDVLLNDGGAGIFATTPSLTTYAGYITDDAGTDNYSIQAEAQSLERWRGDIWQKTTKYVKAL